MSDSVFHNFDSTLSVIGNDVSSDIRLAMLPKDYDSIISTLFNLISPDKRHRPRSIVVTNYLDAVFVGLLNLVVE